MQGVDAVLGRSRRPRSALVDAGLEQRRRLGHRVAEGDDLLGRVGWRRGSRRSSSRPASTRITASKRDLVVDLGDLVRRRQPHRRERAEEVRRVLVQRLGAHAVAAQHPLQRGRPRRDGRRAPIFQFSARCHASRAPAADACASSTSRKSASSRSSTRGVRAEQRLVVGEHRLEHRLPPGELELGGDRLLGHVPPRRGRVSSGSRPRSRSRDSSGGALLQVGEHLGLGGEPGERRDRARAPGARRAGAACPRRRAARRARARSFATRW